MARTAGHEHARSFVRSDFLRAPRGTDSLAQCGRCHVANKQQYRYNPHRMVNADGQVETQSCLFCHSHRFTADDLRHRTGKPALKANEITLCIGCHTQHTDFFEPGHIAAHVTPEILRNVKAAAAGGEMRLPLGRGETIVCSTCHNPHPAGVFPADGILNIGAMHQEDLSTTRPAGLSEPIRSRPVPLRLGAATCGECHAR
jgi:hypothetical protein